MTRTRSTAGLSRHSMSTPCPTMPVAPKRITFMGLSDSQKAAIGVHHFADEILEFDGGCPAQDAARFGCIALEENGLGRTVDLLVDFDVFVVVEARVREGDFDEFADGVALAGCD